MTTIVKVSHQVQDPILGPGETVEHTAEIDADRLTVSGRLDARLLADVLERLFRRFDLPNGGMMTISAFGREIRFDRDGSLGVAAGRLLGRND